MVARSGISLTATKGKKTLGTTRGVNLAAGVSQTVALRLSRAGGNILKSTGSAKAKVTATVPGASPANATQRLR
jgi:hypothetical protein